MLFASPRAPSPHAGDLDPLEDRARRLVVQLLAFAAYGGDTSRREDPDAMFSIEYAILKERRMKP